MSGAPERALGPTEASKASKASIDECAVPPVDALDGIDATVGPTLFGEVENFIRRFLVLPDEHGYVALVLWVAHCYLADETRGFIDSTPRLAFVSPEPGSGKSRALEVIESLVPNPLRLANVTIAVLFRTVASEHRPVVLMDEVDTIWTGPGQAEELRAFVNAGHRRGSEVGRMVGEGKSLHAERFATFTPVALAGLGDLPHTVADRSIMIRMQRRTRAEPIQPWRFRTSVPEGNELAKLLGEWADGIEVLALPEPDEQLADRTWDVWEGLIAIAELVGWRDRALAAARAFAEQAAAATPASVGIRLLADLRRIWPWDASSSFRSSEELTAALRELPDTSWGEEPELTTRRLAGLVKQYGIRSARNTEQTARGYWRKDMAPAWDRYLPASTPNDEPEEIR